MLGFKTLRFCLMMIICLTALYNPAHAASQTIIRDAEIEQMIKTWTTPVIKSAGLSPGAVKIVLVQSPELNAFVAGGQNIFLYTGLLQKTENPGEVIGVVAHELGHIAGGHLVRAGEQAERTSYEVMLGAIVGIGVGAATGSGDAAAAILSGTSSFAQRNMLAFSRTQESSADQAGLRFLKDAQMNPSGLPSFLEKLADQELLPASQQNEYVRTHPLTRDRISTLENDVAQSPLRQKSWSDTWVRDHARMKAKLIGFITPQQVAWAYPADDTSIPAQYAHAIAAYRANQVDDAIKKTNALIEREPNNPYFHELKGQMLYDFGRASSAIAPYARAVELAPDQALIKLGYAQARAEDPRAPLSTLRDTITILDQVRLAEPRNTRVLRLLGTLHGRLGHTGMAQAWLAEEAFLQARYDESRRLANGARLDLPKDSPARQRVEDLIAQLDQIKTKKKKK